ncbi:MAG TPA: gamma-glutamylcyclotransferase [Caldisericia bacterium]|jgi:gamma-glutamylaminecyclotransferase|nr:gamma-glutamylcyclotransferase [Caldisericia bacterium]
MEKTVLLFAYGTLMSGYGNNHYLRNQKLIGSGTTDEKYTMYASGIPFINEEKQTSQIHGELWEVNINALPAIDALEGHPHWYQRKQIPVTINGEKYTAWLYFNNENGGKIVESGNYRTYIKERSLQHG